MAVTASHESQVEIPSGRHTLSGILRVPAHAGGVVAFAHGSGSGRFSPRNQFVARELEEGGLATLLLDLLEEDESKDREKVFDIELLATRLQRRRQVARPRTGYPSASLGLFRCEHRAGAALLAASRQPEAVHAIVSRGGRPDLAQAHLAEVKAPTLLIVGGNDDVVIKLNNQALRRLHCRKQLTIVPALRTCSRKRERSKKWRG